MSNFAKDPNLLKYFDQYWNELSSILLFNKSLNEDEENYVKLLDNIRLFYFQDTEITYK